MKEAAIATGSAVPISMILLLLLGAPLVLKTVLLAIHTAVLLVWAPAYSLGFGAHGSASRFRMKRIFSSFTCVYDTSNLAAVARSLSLSWLIK